MKSLISIVLLVFFIFGCKDQPSSSPRSPEIKKPLSSVKKGKQHQAVPSHKPKISKTSSFSETKKVSDFDKLPTETKNKLLNLKTAIDENNLNKLKSVDVKSLFEDSKDPNQENQKAIILAEYWRSLFIFASSDSKNKEDIIEFCDKLFLDSAKKNKNLIYLIFNKKIKDPTGKEIFIPEFKDKLSKNFYKTLDGGIEAGAEEEKQHALTHEQISKMADYYKDAKNNEWDWLKSISKSFYYLFYRKYVKNVNDFLEKDLKIHNQNILQTLQGVIKIIHITMGIQPNQPDQFLIDNKQNNLYLKLVNCISLFKDNFLVGKKLKSDISRELQNVSRQLRPIGLDIAKAFEWEQNIPTSKIESYITELEELLIDEKYTPKKGWFSSGYDMGENFENDLLNYEKMKRCEALGHLIKETEEKNDDKTKMENAILYCLVDTDNNNQQWYINHIFQSNSIIKNIDKFNDATSIKEVLQCYKHIYLSLFHRTFMKKADKFFKEKAFVMEYWTEYFRFDENKKIVNFKNYKAYKQLKEDFKIGEISKVKGTKKEQSYTNVNAIIQEFKDIEKKYISTILSLTSAIDELQEKIEKKQQKSQYTESEEKEITSLNNLIDPYDIKVLLKIELKWYEIWLSQNEKNTDALTIKIKEFIQNKKITVPEEYSDQNWNIVLLKESKKTEESLDLKNKDSIQVLLINKKSIETEQQEPIIEEEEEEEEQKTQEITKNDLSEDYDVSSFNDKNKQRLFDAFLNAYKEALNEQCNNNLETKLSSQGTAIYKWLMNFDIQKYFKSVISYNEFIAGMKKRANTSKDIYNNIFKEIWDKTLEKFKTVKINVSS